jgi:hypothetical protein
MPKMQQIPNLFLLTDRDDQLAYFILLTSDEILYKRNYIHSTI